MCDWVAITRFFYDFTSSHITRVCAMGLPTKIQLIKRAKSEQWYINFPSAIAQAMEFNKGEIVEWIVENKNKLVLKRTSNTDSSSKKKLNNQP